MKKKLSCLLLAMTLLLSLAGCGNTTNKKPAANKTPSASQSAQNTTGQNSSASPNSGLREDPDANMPGGMTGADLPDAEDGKSQVNEDGVLESDGKNDSLAEDAKDMAEDAKDKITGKTDSNKEKTKIVTKSKTR